MSNVYPTVPPELVSILRDEGSIRTAIETGTFKGNSAIILAELFEHAYSIELLPEIWKAARDKYCDIDNLVFVNADSPVGLRELGGQIDEPVIFWLDAHAGMLYSATESRERTAADERTSGGAKTQCPLLGEIQAIDDFFEGATESCILVDDARAFVTPLLGRRDQDWPPLMDIFDALRAKTRRFVTIIDDIIIAVPLSLRPAVENWRQQKLRERGGQEYHAYQLGQLQSQLHRN